MQTTLIDIKQVFQPLHLRLCEYEQEAFFKEDINRYVFEYGLHRTNLKLMHEISKDLGLYESETISIEINKYEKRISNILHSLKVIDTTFDEVQEDKNGFGYRKEIKLTEEEQKKLMKGWKEELTMYLDELEKIKKIYSVNTKAISEEPKIQWLGKTNVLVTLFYDLWQGQEKGKRKDELKTKPLMKATKQDIEQFLLNNFLDSKGNPLKASVVSDYLNTSKPEKRVKEGIRIEMP